MAQSSRIPTKLIQLRGKLARCEDWGFLMNTADRIHRMTDYIRAEVNVTLRYFLGSETAGGGCRSKRLNWGECNSSVLCYLQPGHQRCLPSTISLLWRDIKISHG
jgi:hypothetical protein